MLFCSFRIKIEHRRVLNCLMLQTEEACSSLTCWRLQAPPH